MILTQINGINLMKKYFILVVSLFLTMQIVAQTSLSTSNSYPTHLQRAEQLYKEKKYTQAGLCYDSLLSHYYATNVTCFDKYNAAKAWSMAGDKEKAFLYLFSDVIDNQYNDYVKIYTDDALNNLHNDGRWKLIIDISKWNMNKISKTEDEIKLNKPLIASLDTILKNDQDGRKNMDAIIKQYGRYSRQMDSLKKNILLNDSINLIKVKDILNKYGWLGPDQIGQAGAEAVFLVIQHADSLTQVTYLPMMREAVKIGKARSSSLALLEDRILTKQGKPQIYGSQLRENPQTGKSEFFPIADEANVNKRRASVGLPPLEEYAKLFGIEYIPKN